MRDYFKNPEFVAKRVAKRAENKKALQEFFIHIGPTLRVTRDRYNIVLTEKCTSKDGNLYTSPIGYYSTLLEMIPKVALDKKASAGDIALYKEKVNGIAVDYHDGSIVMKLPDGFKADPVDINVDDEE